MSGRHGEMRVHPIDSKRFMRLHALADDSWGPAPHLPSRAKPVLWPSPSTLRLDLRGCATLCGVYSHCETRSLWRLHMRHILLLSVLMLGVAWAAAQTGSSSSSSGQSGSSASGSSQAGSTSSGQTGAGDMSATGQSSATSHQSVEGCLSGSDGKYTLTDKQGTSYQLTGDTSKLAEHVGHEVKITGSTGSGAASGTMGSTGSSAGGAGSQTLEVSSVKHISKTCSSGGMSK